MMQESVYVKLAMDKSVSKSMRDAIKKNLPKDGLVQLLEITEKQFNSIEYLVGNKKSKIIDSDERFIIL